MNLIETIRKDNKLARDLIDFCDIEIYQKEQIPNDLNGSTVWNINGMAFGCDASGRVYFTK